MIHQPSQLVLHPTQIDQCLDAPEYKSINQSSVSMINLSISQLTKGYPLFHKKQYKKIPISILEMRSANFLKLFSLTDLVNDFNSGNAF